MPSRWQEPFTVFQTNLQEIDATMDVDAALDVIESHGAGTWLVNAGGISAFYPTSRTMRATPPLPAVPPTCWATPRPRRNSEGSA